MMYNEKMTVYNFKDEEWHRTVVDNIQWRHTRNKIVAKSDGTFAVENSEVVTIDCSSENGYVEPSQYRKEGWTLDCSTKKDVIVQGIAPEVINDEFSINELLKKYKGCSGIVRGITDARNRPYLPIIKVVAN